MLLLGNTTVLCGVKAEVSVPRPDQPSAGYIVPNVDLPPICSPAFKPGPPGEFTQSVTDFVNQVVTMSNIVDLESLCIASGKAVWVIYADIVFLNYEGNAVDASMAALVCALKNTMLPKATFSEVEGTVKATRERTIPLKLNRTPFAATYGLFDAQLIADPADDEEGILATQLSVVVDSGSGHLCGVFKPGGEPLSKEMLDECIAAAKERATELAGVMKMALSLGKKGKK
ncbi:hypothetical protein HDU76_012818 [Blyttiomyces sp. JEL0837]|nr:hypothetical protein HDU76_012818 [Blyttiomyces sp. JEL0837]